MLRRKKKSKGSSSPMAVPARRSTLSAPGTPSDDGASVAEFLQASPPDAGFVIAFPNRARAKRAASGDKEREGSPSPEHRGGLAGLLNRHRSKSPNKRAHKVARTGSGSCSGEEERAWTPPPAASATTTALSSSPSRFRRSTSDKIMWLRSEGRRGDKRVEKRGLSRSGDVSPHGSPSKARLTHHTSSPSLPRRAVSPTALRRSASPPGATAVAQEHFLELVRRIEAERMRECECSRHNAVDIASCALSIVLADESSGSESQSDVTEEEAECVTPPPPADALCEATEADMAEMALQLEAVQQVNRSLMDEVTSLRRQLDKSSKGGPVPGSVGGTPKATGGALGKKATMRVTATPGNVVMEEVLGKGGSGATVYSCTVGGWVCAAKQVWCRQCSEADVECLEKELEILRQMKPHPNVMQYLFHINTPERICIFMSKFTCTLWDYLASLEKPMRPAAALEIVHGVAQGLEALHKYKVIHCDLKAANVFVTVDLERRVRRVAIGDFDCAVIVDESFEAHSGTPGYSAPEFLNTAVKDRIPSYAWDVYSFGMVIYEVLMRKAPFYHLDPTANVAQAAIDGEKPKIDSDVREVYPRALWNIHRHCIKPVAERADLNMINFMLTIMSTTDSEVSYNSMRKTFKGLVNKEATSSVSNWKTTKMGLL